MSIKPIPTFKYERMLACQGYQRIAGTDEAGCGALAGPVVAGAVILPLNSRIGGIRDSKLLRESQREELYAFITSRAVAWSIGSASVEEIYTLGIRQANYLAIRRAVEALSEIDYVLVDAWTIPNLSCPQKGIIRGDQSIKSIAAASIIAKVTRDRMMKVLSEQYPEYGFEKHKGYGTVSHKKAIHIHGPCAIHRLNFHSS
ncbi:MAG: Ribonuclease HII [Candidatus Uhrbacteria bacterium GW2011_GWF2_39_13]|uniref:Ribonuclease HII n=1 Tax=Candidatus Uhrbacteria bacterium GW2011_GWF2_39_13 TaxID=1618995 RepID=A0A0G0Q1J9_9BACT|nr:MAG: Ribonuclease HII [Candidatus Uhrbacteria bacterium GW2011_GWF2_39_13]HAU65766.1 ribonuclease HII [Candidatus Uhrbacteria bacterium]